jgi:hypothetical protein
MKYGLRKMDDSWTKAENCMCVCAMCVAGAAVILAAWAAWYCWESAIWRLFGE